VVLAVAQDRVLAAALVVLEHQAKVTLVVLVVL
jgi:hypothetical protein